MDFPAPQSAVKRYGVSIVGPKYEYFYEDPESGEIECIELRGRLSLSFDEHLAHVRDRAIIANGQAQAMRALAKGFEAVNATTDEEATAAGVSRDVLVLDRMHDLTDKVGGMQVEQWERIKLQVLRLLNPTQREQFMPILERQDPAAINELLDDMEKDIVERQRRDTTVAAHVDPISPPPPSGSSVIPTSGPASDSTE